MIDSFSKVLYCRFKRQIIFCLTKMFYVLSRAWDKEKVLSPHEESNLRPSDSALQCSTTEL